MFVSRLADKIAECKSFEEASSQSAAEKSHAEAANRIVRQENVSLQKQIFGFVWVRFGLLSNN